MTYQVREGQGSLFVNSDKQGDQPDYRGNVRIGGMLYRLAGWKRTAQSGATWLSLKAEPDQPREKTVAESARVSPLAERKAPPSEKSSDRGFPAAEEFNDDIPF